MKGNKIGAHFFQLTDSDKVDIRQMTLAGKSADYIANWIGCCAQTVRRYKNIMGFGTEHYGKRYWKKKDNETLINMYNEGVPLADIADKLGRTREAIIIRCSKLRAKGVLPYRNKRKQ